MEELPQRKSTRLKTHNYSNQDAYFVTICLQDRTVLLSYIRYNSDTLCANAFLTEKGSIINRCIEKIPDKYSQVTIDNYCIMPDHIHLLLSIHSASSNQQTKADLNAIIGWFKYQATKECNLADGTPGKKLFQRSYFDHIIRNNNDYDVHWEYIDSNVNCWVEKMQNKSIFIPTKTK